MKKLLQLVTAFVLLFVVHFAVSLLLNRVFFDNENIVKTIISSLVFAVLYFIIMPFLSKMRKDKEN